MGLFITRVKMKKVKLQDDLQLTKLDKRSRDIPTFFTHRVDAFKISSARNFLNWGIESFGNFELWNFYVKERFDFRYCPKWAIRYQDPTKELTEFFIREDLISLVLMRWQGDGKQI